jgi:hypothetical protein
MLELITNKIVQQKKLVILAHKNIYNKPYFKPKKSHPESGSEWLFIIGSIIILHERRYDSYILF